MTMAASPWAPLVSLASCSGGCRASGESKKQPGSLRNDSRFYAGSFAVMGPVIGILAIVPIIYLSVTGIMVDHIFALIDYGKTVPLQRESLPPIYQYKTLEGEISSIVAYPGEPEAISISTRLGCAELNRQRQDLGRRSDPADNTWNRCRAGQFIPRRRLRLRPALAQLGMPIVKLVTRFGPSLRCQPITWLSQMQAAVVTPGI